MPEIRVGQVDMSTGEILEGAALAVFYPKRKNGFQSGGWFAVSQEPLMKLAQANLGGEAMRVLFVLFAKLDFENYLVVNQSEIARDLGIKQPHVSRAISRLKQEGVLLAGPRLHNLATYTLNPHYGWKGSAKGHNEALQARMKARGLTVVGGAQVPDDQTMPLPGLESV